MSWESTIRPVEPLSESGPSISESAARVRLPPEMTSASDAVKLFADWAPELIVIVGLAPVTLITTSSFVPGTFPLLQLLATFQSPLAVEIHL